MGNEPVLKSGKWEIISGASYSEKKSGSFHTEGVMGVEKRVPKTVFRGFEGQNFVGTRHDGV